jgi:predicted membrane protein
MKFKKMDNSGNDIREDMANDIKEDVHNRIRRRHSGRVFLPVGLVVIGGLLLARQMGAGIPEWLFSWQMLLIGIGIFSGLAHEFRGPGWLIMILIGTFFLLDQLIPGLDIHRFIWPAAIIVVGLIMLIRPKKPYWMDHRWHERWNQKDRDRWQRRRQRRGYPGFSDMGPNSGSKPNPGMSSGGNTGTSSNSFSSEDYIDATTVLGGIHKNILSKNFKGGDITIFMGGAEINLSQADIQGTASLDITQIMGGTKLIVPANWEVRSQLTSVFGNIEDKRQNIGNTDPQKVLIIDGTSVFGGIEIRNY